MTHTKAEWRERLLRARCAIDPVTRRDAAAAVVARLAKLTSFAGARVVLLYDALGAELDVSPLASAASRARKDVYRPATAEPPPTWKRVDAGVGESSSARSSEIVAGGRHPCDVPASGICDFPADAASAERLACPILLIVPAVGLDVHGGRLGRGRGYYDRAIATLRAVGEVVVVGVGFDAQVVDTLPHDPWDQRVDLVVTERRVLVPQPSRPCDPSHGAREEVRDDV